jgi:desampylase
VTLSPAAEVAILDHARRQAPDECCGLLIGREDTIVDAVPAANVADEPRRRYRIDPAEHFRVIRAARGRALDVVGAYHSHPRSTAVPSDTDRAEAFSDFVFLIVGLDADPPELTAWSWRGGNFAAVPLVRLL